MNWSWPASLDVLKDRPRTGRGDSQQNGLNEVKGLRRAASTKLQHDAAAGERGRHPHKPVKSHHLYSRKKVTDPNPGRADRGGAVMTAQCMHRWRGVNDPRQFSRFRVVKAARITPRSGLKTIPGRGAGFMGRPSQNLASVQRAPVARARPSDGAEMAGRCPPGADGRGILVRRSVFANQLAGPAKYSQVRWYPPARGSKTGRQPRRSVELPQSLGCQLPIIMR